MLTDGITPEYQQIGILQVLCYTMPVYHATEQIIMNETMLISG